MKFFRLMFCFLSLISLQSQSAISATWEVYTTDQTSGGNGVVEVLATPANTLEPPVLIPGSVINWVAITPDAKTAYVTDALTPTIYPIDTATKAIGTPIIVDAVSGATHIGITPDGKTMIVTLIGPVLYAIDLPSLVQTPFTLTATQFLDFAITPDGKKVYITNAADDTILIADILTKSEDPASPIALPTGSGPSAIKITPDGTTAIVVETNVKSIIVVDLATNTVVNTTPLVLASTAFIDSLAISPDGKQVYVGIGDGIVLANNEVLPFTLQNFILTPQAPIPLTLGDRVPLSIAFTPDGTSAYLACLSSNTLAQISGVKTATPASTFSTPLAASGSAIQCLITPDQAPTASFTFSPNKIKQFPTVVHFDASSSSSPIGTIAKYRWDFGDGSPVVTRTTPTISHTYTHGNNNFIVTLTVTNTAGTSNRIVYSSTVVSNNGGPSAVQRKTLANQVVFPPRDFRGKQVAEKFATQTDLINVLKWDPPTSGNEVVSYAIYRNQALTELVAIVPTARMNLKDLSGSFPDHPLGFSYLDHNRHPHIAYTYFIVSVDANGNKSDPVSVTVPPRN